MGKQRKQLLKGKSKSSIMKNRRRLQENYEVLNELKDNETRRKGV